ncbi:MAG TPA: hypothetical protein VNN73_06955 [Blastocatellia bacterium]|nr:hypothetical protein [Blastocatellia bacterium]
MSAATVEFTHQELSLLLFALEGGAAEAGAQSDDDVPCEESCPVADHFEVMFESGALPPDKRLAHHLNTHLREGLIESGAFEFMAAMREGRAPSTEEQAKMRQINERLKSWRCEIKLNDADRALLNQSMKRLPRSAWVTMPRVMWRLRKKLKAR